MMENSMTTDASETTMRKPLADEPMELNRDLAFSDRSVPHPAWALDSELRGSLNALNLCIRVLEGNLSDAEAREYVKHISAATQRIERLLAKRNIARSA